MNKLFRPLKLVFSIFIIPAIFYLATSPSQTYAQTCGDPCNPAILRSCPASCLCEANLSGDYFCGGGTRETCADPATGECETGIGSISINPQGFIEDIASRAAAVVGGLALLFLMYGSILFIFSKGDPKAVEKAQQIITSALAGLLFVIFSVLILRIIGINILKLNAIVPGFGPGPPGGVELPG